jgi:hypothetical protein
MIDEASEKRLGGFPVDRAIVADVVERLAGAGVKGVVLKFFYDLPSKPASDAVLAKALTRTKVLLQAKLDDDEAMPNRLPDRFWFDAPPGNVAVGGLSGWIPLPMLSANAHDVGFVDVRTPDKVPAYERFLDRNVKSLTVATLQLAMDDATMRVRPGDYISFGSKKIRVDAENQIAVSFDTATSLRYTAFIDIVDGKANLAAMRGKVVVIGYNGAKMPVLNTASGAIKAHRVFYLGLLDAYRQLR